MLVIHLNGYTTTLKPQQQSRQWLGNIVGIFVNSDLHIYRI
jgi:hypothetical protein